MSKKKPTYKDFFNIAEQQSSDPGHVRVPKNTKPDDIKDLTDRGLDVELQEAELINSITDYKGGVQYMLRDASAANKVAQEIKQFANKKKIYTVKHIKSKSGKAGYFYFRLGEDPAKESQQLQGYFSQMPEIAYFRFKILEETPRQQDRNI